ncbi:MAG: ligase-like protein [Francisellaceae bacterium]|nr:ligase-like protein [Francisellaceae bacterium]
MSLDTYWKKRDFCKTAEPKGVVKTDSSREFIFVIQEHHASHLHYDFRLEMNGILKSWAVPKGVPSTTKERHLAILTEDHPIEYAEFEGSIPKEEYGGGEVYLWDKGTYKNLTQNKEGKELSMSEAFDSGHIFIELLGQKLQNQCFTLHRFKKTPTLKTQKEQWLLIRSNIKN